MEVLTKSHKNEKKKTAKCHFAQEDTAESSAAIIYIPRQYSCIHPHEKQYAEKSFIESKVKRKKHIGTVNVSQ